MLNYAEMPAGELIDSLFQDEDRVSIEQIEAVIARGQEVAPRLREILADEFYWYEGQGGDHFIVVHAITALAGMRDVQALPLLMAMIEHAYFADHTEAQEVLAAALAQYGPGAVDRFIAYITELRGAYYDSQDFGYCRHTVAAALAQIALETDDTALYARIHDFILATFRDPQEKDYLFLSYGVALPYVLDKERGLRVIKAAYGRRAISPALAGPYPDCVAELRDPDSHHYHEIEADLLDFYQPDQIIFRQKQRDEAEEEKLYWEPEQVTAPAGYAFDQGGSAVRTDKTGRNDPCPCGSGKKYKKCCGQ